jgi:hypothetical protein
MRAASRGRSPNGPSAHHAATERTAAARMLEGMPLNVLLTNDDGIEAEGL